MSVLWYQRQCTDTRSSLCGSPWSECRLNQYSLAERTLSVEQNVYVPLGKGRTKGDPVKRLEYARTQLATEPENVAETIVVVTLVGAHLCHGGMEGLHFRIRGSHLVDF